MGGEEELSDASMDATQVRERMEAKMLMGWVEESERAGKVSTEDSLLLRQWCEAKSGGRELDAGPD